MLDWQLPGFNNYYKGAPCGRHKLEVIGLERPDLVDFGDTGKLVIYHALAPGPLDGPIPISGETIRAITPST